MDHHRQMQDIQLARCSSQHHGSEAAVTARGDSAGSLEMCPALYLAAYKGRAEERHGQCNISEVSAESNTVFHVAAEQGHDELIREVYLRFKESSLLSRRNSSQDTPLHCAARAGHAGAVTAIVQLLALDSILGCKNEAGDTALHLAARNGHGAAVEALVSAAAPELSSELNAAGVSPLYLAVMSKSVTAVKAIITTCSDASPVGPNKQNALHAAVFQSSEMVDLVLKWKPALSGQCDVKGSSPLHLASSDGDRSIVSAIVRAAPPSTAFLKDSDGLSAIHVAARMGHHHVVEELISAWPDAAELRDGRGRTFLHAAAEKGHAPVISLAVKNPMLCGIVNAQDKDGNTALHLAVAAAASKGLAALLSAGDNVRVNIMNNDGYTPFDLAANSSSFLSMISLVVTLSAYGAQSCPQRQDHLNQWRGKGTTDWIRKTSNSLAVVAVLVATVAFSATFNVPGGYGDDGKAVLQAKTAYKFFIVFDSIAMTTSVVAVILIVYGKASGSWKSFIFALHFMWVSMIGMIVAFWAALVAVMSRRTINIVVYEVIVNGIYLLVLFVVNWTKPASWMSIVKFMFSSLLPEGHHRRVARQYPFAGAYSRNYSVFVLTNILAYIHLRFRSTPNPNPRVLSLAPHDAMSLPFSSESASTALEKVVKAIADTVRDSFTTSASTDVDPGTALTIANHRQGNLLEVTAERNTVLHVAAEKGHGELIQELYHRFIRDNSLLSRRNSAMDTPLHCAARAGHAGTVTILVNLAQDCEENILGCQNAAGDTALHLAARHGHGATVEALVAARAKATELNKAGVSPLYLAVMSRSVPAVRAIVTTCSDASPVGPSSQNALHAAVFRSLEMVRLLLQWKPELASQVDCNGSTPLHFAASDGNGKIVHAILAIVPTGTVYMKDSDGLSALHVAARLGHANVVKQLIGICPDAVELRDGHGETFLHTAVREKRSSIVSLAIKKHKQVGGLLDAQDGDGNTPLHIAVVAGSPDIVNALLHKGKVQSDVLNDDGHSPLDLASTSTNLFNMVGFVVILVAFGAQGRPQRNDHLKPWSGRDIGKGIERTSDSLAVVAVLIATVAFAAGFNMPGSYGDDGTANLKGRFSFKWFMVLDTVAVAASVVAVILLVYGKASRSAGSWKSFVAALHFIWVSLISLILAFFAAFRAAMRTSRAVSIVFMVIYVCLIVLAVNVGTWVEPVTTMRIFWRFVWRSHRTAVKRQYPFAVAAVYNCLLLSVYLDALGERCRLPTSDINSERVEAYRYGFCEN
uniref:PGG domain-containing protein n=1 Tax=Oryza glumipatula TaxID=40148 RepID=A0A0E0BG37_9ORYZ